MRDVLEALQREMQGKERCLSEILEMILNHAKKTEKLGLIDIRSPHAP
jgi:hypothetical protein